MVLGPEVAGSSSGRRHVAYCTHDHGWHITPKPQRETPRHLLSPPHTLPPTGRGWTGAAGSREDGGPSKETYRARVLVAGLVTCVFVLAIGAAPAQAVTPGWECIPTTAGQAVVSGGTGGAPSCGAGTTAVLAPTFISSGVGGKPTVQFSAVNVQIVNGMASEATTNGEGNLVVGYNEKGGAQTGSHNLVLGGSNSYTTVLAETCVGHRVPPVVGL